MFKLSFLEKSSIRPLEVVYLLLLKQGACIKRCRLKLEVATLSIDLEIDRERERERDSEVREIQMDKGEGHFKKI